MGSNIHHWNKESLGFQEENGTVHDLQPLGCVHLSWQELGLGSEGEAALFWG